MSYNGSGTFNINTAGQPVVTGTTITSTAFNLLTADLATGLSTALTKDGQTTPTANIPLGGFKITGLGAGTAATDAAQYGQLQAGATTIATVTGTDTYVGTLSPAIAAYATGNLFSFVAPNTNTGAATINLNSLGAKNITKLGSTALAAGDIVSGRVYQIEYDGTRFQLLNPSASTVASFSAGSTGFTPSSATTGAITLAGTLATTNGGTGLTSFTANGVVYASSTSALTTGSALTFDGTFANLTLTSGTTGNGFLQFSNSADGGTQGYIGDSKALISGGANSSLAVRGESNILFGIASAEQMRLTSTGLGIGTSSPSYKLDVQSSSSPTIRVRNTANGINNYSQLLLETANNFSGSGDAYLRAISMNGGNSSTSLAFGVNADGGGAPYEAMRIDSSGNLGLGVTPSAWVSGDTILQVKSGSSITSLWGRNASGRLISNAYYDGTNYKYYATGTATSFENNVSGGYNWNTAPSGTAGNAITFTQAMTLDASGNLLVGTTSAYSGRLAVQDRINGTVYSVLRNSYYDTAACSAAYSINLGNGFAYMKASIPSANSGSTSLEFHVSNGGSDVTAATIDSSGNLLVGTTATNASLTQGVTAVIGSGASKIHIGHATGTVDGSTYAVFSYNGTAIGTITQSLTSAVLYNTTSDYRLKTVVGAVTGHGERIDALEPIEYEWKVDGSHTRGFLAHKFQEVYPKSVSGDKDAVDAEGNPIYQAMQAGTAEVIADLVAEIQSLRKRLADAGL